MDSNKKSFTLTEVLIVLVIIGALALIIIPNLANLMPDDHAIKYKKAFYTIQEIVNDMVNDPSVCTGYTVDTSGDTPVYNYVNSDVFLSTCGWCKTLNDSINPPSCTSYNNLREVIFDKLSTVDASASDDIQTTNGMHWYIPETEFANTSTGFGTSGNTVSIYVSIDNAAAASAASSGAGIFEIVIHADGKVTPGTANGETQLLTKNKM